MEISTITPIALGFILIFSLFGTLVGGLRVGASFAALFLGSLLAFPMAPWVEPLLTSTPIPLALRPVAAVAAIGLFNIIVIRILFSIALGMRERKRKDQGLSSRSPLDRGLGALLGAAWGTLLVLFVLGGIAFISDVQTAIEMPTAMPESLDLGGIRLPPEASMDPERIAEVPDPLRPPEPSPIAQDADGGTFETLGKKVSSSVFGPLVEKTSPLGNHQAETIRSFVSLLEDPDALRRLRRQPEVQNLLENPLILDATNDSEIADAIRRRDLYFLLNHPTIASLAHDPGLRQEILSLDLDDLLRRSQSR